MRQNLRLRSVLAVVGTTSCLLLLPVACGDDKEAVVQSESTTPSESAPTTAVSSTETSTTSSLDESADSSDGLQAHSDSWATEGERIRADKRENATKNGFRPFNAGDYAYQSQPVDVSGPGQYETTVGPIDGWVDYELKPDRPSSIDNKPLSWVVKRTDDQRFDIQLIAAHVINEGDQRLLAVTFNVIEDPGFTPYPGYSFWLY